jgi:hypothetical protein
MSVLADRLIAIHDALDKARIPHAFGGAIALAYCTKEPRGTRDLDVNVFVGVEKANDVFDALPTGVTTKTAHRTAARREGQVRVMWEDTPIDLFFDQHEFHHEAARDVAHVPFEGKTIPVLSCESLLVFKAIFDRTRDWADIEAMLDAGAVNGKQALDQLRPLLGRTHPAVRRLAALLK